MILSLEKVRELFPAFNDWTDDKLTLKLCAVENAIRAYTNNKFHNRYYRNTADIIGGVISAYPCDGAEKNKPTQAVESKLIQTAGVFLGKQMES